jgi:hypothetical protein
MSATELSRVVGQLVQQVGHWQQARWSATGNGPGRRADRVYALAQRLADLAADVEQRPHRVVPRLGDLVLPDQLKVLADDLVAVCASAETLAAAAADVDAVRRAL